MQDIGLTIHRSLLTINNEDSFYSRQKQFSRVHQPSLAMAKKKTYSVDSDKNLLKSVNKLCKFGHLDNN